MRSYEEGGGGGGAWDARDPLFVSLSFKQTTHSSWSKRHANLLSSLILT